MEQTEVKPYSIIAEHLGLEQPKEEDIYITKGGVMVVSEGEPDFKNLVKKALSL